MSSGNGATSDYQFGMKIPPGLSRYEAMVVLKRYNDGEPFNGIHFSVLGIDDMTGVATIQSARKNEDCLRNVLPGHIEQRARELVR